MNFIAQKFHFWASKVALMLLWFEVIKVIKETARCLWFEPKAFNVLWKSPTSWDLKAVLSLETDLFIIWWNHSWFLKGEDVLIKVFFSFWKYIKKNFFSLPLLRTANAGTLIRKKACVTGCHLLL